MLIEDDEWLTNEYLEPADGGCWFCHLDNCAEFSFEFDTNFHLECLKEAEKDPKNREAKIMWEEHIRS